jgi:hypothetical protein
MSLTLEELEAVVRNRICSVCTDRTVDGKCGLEEPEGCALFRLFPEVAKAIQATNSDQIGDYIDAIRQTVCSACNERAADGTCEVREQVRCALDAYLLLIVEIIEEATGKTLSRERLNVPDPNSVVVAPASSRHPFPDARQAGELRDTD